MVSLEDLAIHINISRCNNFSGKTNRKAPSIGVLNTDEENMKANRHIYLVKT